jgi:hypothetical protein
MERARALAREFYLLEVAERERLEGTMHWHAHIQGKETGETSPVAGFRRFGISAGVELGNLNRYRNIFPVSLLAPTSFLVLTHHCLSHSTIMLE